MKCLTTLTRRRRDVDDASASVLFQIGHHGIADVENTFQIHFQSFVPNVLRRGPYLAERPDSCIVDNYVDPAERPYGLLHKLPPDAALAYISLVGDNLAA